MGLLKTLFSASYRKDVSQKFVKDFNESEEELEGIYLQSMRENGKL